MIEGTIVAEDRVVIPNRLKRKLGRSRAEIRWGGWAMIHSIEAHRLDLSISKYPEHSLYRAILEEQKKIEERASALANHGLRKAIESRQKSVGVPLERCLRIARLESWIESKERRGERTEPPSNDRSPRMLVTTGASEANAPPVLISSNSESFALAPNRPRRSVDLVT